MFQETIAFFATLNLQENRKRSEETQRIELVPSQWPDSPTSMSGIHAKAASQASVGSSTEIDYGLLSLNLWNLRSKIQGQWKPRAILEHDGSCVEYDLQWCPVLQFGPGSGSAGAGTTLRCDMSLKGQTCTPVLHLFFERETDSSRSRRADVVKNLGSINLGLFSEPSTREFKSYPLNDGAVEIDITLTFSRQPLPNLPDRIPGKWRRNQGRDLGGLELVETTDTDMFYLMATVCADEYREGSAQSSLDNPWTLPVRFLFRSPGHLHLLSPVSSNWHLLGLVQRSRLVTNEEAQLYAAQLLLALESLHKVGVIGLLSSENILLDVFRNIRITTPRLFTNDQSQCLDQSAYAAPEVLNGDTPSQATDWWILGCFLYEMLTGLPPFHHQDPAERHYKVLKEEPSMPSHFQPHTADFLQRLLRKQPNQRFGGGDGISEIKKHNFFLGVNWQNPTAEHSKLSPFQPHNWRSILTNSPRRPRSRSPAKDPSALRGPPKRQYLDGNLIVEVSNHRGTKRTIGRLRRTSDIFNPLLSEALEEAHLGPNQTAARALQADSEREGYDTEAVMARLKAALQNKQSTEKVAYILDGCTSQVLASVLKSPILVVNETPVDTIAHVTLECDIPINALEWTVELGRVDLVLLLLNRGADPNWTFDERYGPALTRAARERRTELVDILAPMTSRVLAIRTLCLAVEQRDTLSAGSLLSHGVPSEFDEADHLLGCPRTSHFDWYHGEDHSWAPKPTFNLGPLVRATRHGDVAMVQLLLTYGASPNTAYHDLINLVPETHATWQDAIMGNFMWNCGFVCGRVVQLAMQLGHQDVVDALLEGGADVWLPHPEWPVPRHFCPLVPRSIYLQVTGELSARGR
ncbi:ribosomal protein S6 kinase alpha-2 [Sarocladium strictum]